MRYPTLEDWAQARDADQHTKVRELLPRLDWHALWEQEDEEEWLLYPLIPARRLIALFSPAKVGKSLLMLEIAAALSTGKKVLGHDPGRRIRVLYIDFENDPRGDVRTRLQDMDYEPGDLEYLDYLSFPSLPYLDSEAGASALLAAVEAYAPELVVIDTISRAVHGEENDNNTWLNLYKHTGLALKQAKVAMIRLDHTGKDETKGQRGGSAKSGDVDAIWKLALVAEGRFRLECISSRFPLETKELTLIRHDDPLGHDVQDIGVGGGDREAKIRQIIELADRDGLDSDLGRGPKLAEWAVGRNLKARNDVWSEVVRRRKTSGGLVFEPLTSLKSEGSSGISRGFTYESKTQWVNRKQLSPTPGTELSTKTVSPPQGQVSPGTNGNNHFPLSELSPGNGDSRGQSEVAELSPALSLYKRAGRDSGRDSDPKPGDKPCTECGEPLGWSLVRRNQTRHTPVCPNRQKEHVK